MVKVYILNSNSHWYYAFLDPGAAALNQHTTYNTFNAIMV